jgi:hypothetical protein
VRVSAHAPVCIADIVSAAVNFESLHYNISCPVFVLTGSPCYLFNCNDINAVQEAVIMEDTCHCWILKDTVQAGSTCVHAPAKAFTDCNFQESPAC